MFVYDFLQLEAPIEEIRRHLMQDEAQQLAVLGEAVSDDGESVSFGRTVDQDDVIVLPFQWRANGPVPAFPTVDGHFEVSSLGSGRTHISLLANYTPPGGYFGRLADRMGLHHLVEAGVRGFLRRFADGVSGAAAPIAA